MTEFRRSCCYCSEEIVISDKEQESVFHPYDPLGNRHHC